MIFKQDKFWWFRLKFYNWGQIGLNKDLTKNQKGSCYFESFEIFWSAEKKLENEPHRYFRLNSSHFHDHINDDAKAVTMCTECFRNILVTYIFWIFSKHSSLMIWIVIVQPETKLSKVSKISPKNLDHFLKTLKDIFKRIINESFLSQITAFYWQNWNDFRIKRKYSFKAYRDLKKIRKYFV